DSARASDVLARVRAVEVLQPVVLAVAVDHGLLPEDARQALDPIRLLGVVHDDRALRTPVVALHLVRVLSFGSEKVQDLLVRGPALHLVWVGGVLRAEDDVWAKLRAHVYIFSGF